MLGSYNHFFTQSKTVLRLKRKDVWDLLFIKGYSTIEIDVYLKAYDYFVVNEKEFDGATVVKDLCDIPDLDLNAMLHDYHYINYQAGTNFKYKRKADFMYLKGMEKNGKGVRLGRFVWLTWVEGFFVPYAYLKRGKITAANKKSIDNDYKILIK